MDETRRFLGLLTGVSKQLFFDDAAVTDELLLTELFEGAADDFPAAKAAAEKLLQNAASNDMDLAKLERFLNAQMSKPGGITQEQAAAMAKFWKKERGKVQDQLLRKTMWKDRLTGVSWRIDVPSKSRHISELSEPTSIVELKVAPSQGKDNKSIKFEMDSKQLTAVLAEMEAIEQQIKAL